MTCPLTMTQSNISVMIVPDRTEEEQWINDILIPVSTLKNFPENPKSG
jgi:hypothetical protein